MSVAREQAERIAALARLRFEADELTRITQDLNHILDHVEVLRTLEASAGEGEAEWEGVTPPTAESTTRGPGAERPDPLRIGLETFAPDAREGFFVVPPFPGVHEGDGA